MKLTPAQKLAIYSKSQVKYVAEGDAMAGPTGRLIEELKLEIKGDT